MAYTLLEKAIKRYFRDNGVNAEQPSLGLSGVRDDKYGHRVCLKNINGDLAVYKVTQSGRLILLG